MPRACPPRPRRSAANSPRHRPPVSPPAGARCVLARSSWRDAIAISPFTIAPEKPGFLGSAPAQTREFDTANGCQFGEAGFERLPDDLALTGEVFVGEDIAHAEDLPPRNMRMARFQIIIEILGRLANGQKTVCRRILDVRVLQERLTRQPVSLPFDLLDEFENVQQAVD